MTLTLLSLLTLATFAQQPNVDAEPPVRAPFEQLDTLCTDDWWNRDPSPIVDTRVPRDEVIGFGIYTVHAGSLKLSAQLFPLYPDETRTVRLELLADGEWVEAARWDGPHLVQLVEGLLQDPRVGTMGFTLSGDPVLGVSLLPQLGATSAAGWNLPELRILERR